MEHQPGTSPLRYFLTGLILALVGIAGLCGVVFLSQPLLGPRWLFFFSLFLGLAGFALPLVWYVNRRFSPARFPSDGVLWRESLELAVLIVLLVWLQTGRMLNAFLGWILFCVFLAVEVLLRIYEQSRWSPRFEPPAASIPAEDGIPPATDSPPGIPS